MRISNKLRSFFIVLLSIVVVMAALPLNAFRVQADPTTNSWNVIYHSNDDRHLEQSYTEEPNDSHTVLSADFVSIGGVSFAKEYYTLVGWYTTADDTTGKEYQPGGTVDPSDPNSGIDSSDELHLYAHWSLNSDCVEVKLHINSTDAEGSDATVIVPKTGTTGIAMPESWTEPDHCRLCEWTTNSDGTGNSYSISGSYTLADGDTDLYAKWKQVYIITYKSNNSFSQTFTDTYDIDSTEPYQILDPFTFNGYIVDYWSGSPGNAGGKNYDASATIPSNEMSDLELNAQWARQITFHANNGTEPEETATQYILINETKDLDTNTFGNSDPQKEFFGWTTTSTGTTIDYADGASVEITGENSEDVKELYALWAVPCTITFDANDTELYNSATGSMTSQVVGKGLTTPLNANAFQATGYTFNGWNTKADGTGTPYQDRGIIELADYEGETLTLYAQWTPVKYTVKFMDDGNELQSSQVAYGETPSYTGSTPTRASSNTTNYEFTGWSPSITAVTDDATYTAQYKETVRYYNVTVSTDDSIRGSVSLTGVDSAGIQYQASLTAVATPAHGYKFVEWTDKDGNPVSSQASYSFLVGGNTDLVAVFELDTFNISIESASSTMGSATIAEGEGAHVYQSTVTVIATAEEGYEFVNWTDKDTGTELSTNATYVHTVDDNRTLVANFALKSYPITVSSDGNGEVSGGGDSINHFETVTVTATPNEGYAFINWTENGTEVSTDASYTFVVSGERNIVANFGILSYEVTVASVGSGDVAGAGTYNHFFDTTVTASPATGYHFVNWTEDGIEVSTDANYTFTVTGPRNLIANFAVNSYEIKLYSDGHGYVSNETIYFNHFEEVTISTTPNDGYHFVNWTDKVTGDVVSTSATYTYAFNGSYELVANFAINKYSITVTSNNTDYGTVSPYLFSGVDHFSSVTVNATPAEGYHFVGWVENGTLVSDKETYTFTVTGNRKLEGVFDVNMYTVTYKDDNGTILQQSQFAWGTNAYYQKTTPTKAPTAQYTYKFAGWDNKVTLVTGDVTYTAVYDKTVNQYTVTFVNADGKVLQTGLVDYGAMPTYDGETPVKAATVEYTYTFAGWDKEITKVQGDITYTATYSEKKFEKGDIDYVYFKVMFNSNGGSDVVTQLVQDGYTATIPDDPMRERYNFAGWYLDEDLTKPFSFSTPITSDITLYAKWVKGVQEVTVTYAVVGDGTVKWEAGSSEGVVITVDRSQDNDTGAEHFKSVQIDGEEVAYFNYEVSEGSATITLSTDILKDMAPGTYKVTILFDDGQAEVDLVIEGGETPTEEVTETPTEAGDPATGDDGGNTTGPNYIGLWIALGVVALVCIAAAPILIIKRRGVK